MSSNSNDKSDDGRDRDSKRPEVDHLPGYTYVEFQNLDNGRRVATSLYPSPPSGRHRMEKPDVIARRFRPWNRERRFVNVILATYDDGRTCCGEAIIERHELLTREDAMKAHFRLLRGRAENVARDDHFSIRDWEDYAVIEYGSCTSAPNATFDLNTSGYGVQALTIERAIRIVEPTEEEAERFSGAEQAQLCTVS